MSLCSQICQHPACWKAEIEIKKQAAISRVLGYEYIPDKEEIKLRENQKSEKLYRENKSKYYNLLLFLIILRLLTMNPKCYHIILLESISLDKLFQYII